jgi:uncharacterized protein YbcI
MELGTETSLSREVAQAMVGLYKENVGRGPTRARAFIQGDVITVILEDTMTRAEQTLAEEEEKELVRGVRRVLQGKFREEAVALVERLTGRRVRSFLSDHAVEDDVAAEVFVLEPEDEV